MCSVLAFKFESGLVLASCLKVVCRVNIYFWSLMFDVSVYLVYDVSKWTLLVFEVLETVLNSP